MHADFNELCALVEKKGPDLQDLICHIFATTHVGDTKAIYGEGVDNSKDFYGEGNNFADGELKRSLLEEPEPYEKIFPELFLYWSSAGNSSAIC